MTQNSDRIAIIDGLRGVSVIMVVIFSHYIGNHFDLSTSQVVGLYQLLDCFIDVSNIGVRLFFIISGFLLGGILLENRGRRSFFLTFYIRRLLRILPLYYLNLLLFLLVL